MILVAKKQIRLFLLLILISLSSCFNGGEVFTIQGETMGTTYSVKVSAQEKVDVEKLRKEIDKFLYDFNKIFSTYDPHSELSLLNKHSNKRDGIVISKPLQKQIAIARQYYEFSQKAFDPSIAPLINLWNFGYPRIPEDEFVLPTPEEIREVQKKMGMDHIQLEGNHFYSPNFIRLDFSAISKGRAVDEVDDLLERNGYRHYLVEIGGELSVKGNKKALDSSVGDDGLWKILISSPDNGGGNESVQVLIDLKDQAIATSGDYNNYYQKDGVRYSHTIDPRTGKPITHSLASVSIIAPSCEEADALATAIMVMGEREGREFVEHHNLAAYLIYRKGSGFESYASKKFKNHMIEKDILQ